MSDWKTWMQESESKEKMRKKQQVLGKTILQHLESNPRPLIHLYATFFLVNIFPPLETQSTSFVPRE